jgi:hypothetical protein
VRRVVLLPLPVPVLGPLPASLLVVGDVVSGELFMPPGLVSLLLPPVEPCPVVFGVVPDGLFPPGTGVDAPPGAPVAPAPPACPIAVPPGAVSLLYELLLYVLS